VTAVGYRNGYFAVGQDIGDVAEPGKSGGKAQSDVDTVYFVELREEGAQ